MPLEPAGAPPRQLSLFGVEAGDPVPADLAGLLAGPGGVTRMGGTARVSVAVDAAWRVHVLAAEFARRGLATSWLPVPGGGYGVRTAYTGLLAPLAVAWLRAAEAVPPRPAGPVSPGVGAGLPPRGGGKRPPPKFHLNGHRLRLWVAAAGSPEPLGFLLRLGAGDELCWEPVGAALAAIGLPAVLVTPRVVARAIPKQAGPPPDESVPPESWVCEEEAAPMREAAARGDQPAAVDELPEDDHDDHTAARDRGGGAALDEGWPVPPEPPRATVGPAYRITGRRRLGRLAELVGERPAAAPAHVWPGDDA